MRYLYRKGKTGHPGIDKTKGLGQQLAKAVAEGSGVIFGKVTRNSIRVCWRIEDGGATNGRIVMKDRV